MYEIKYYDSNGDIKRNIFEAKSLKEALSMQVATRTAAEIISITKKS